MNKENLLKLADYLEQLDPANYSQDSWCGSACCIAGHAVHALGTPEQQAGFAKVQKEWRGFVRGGPSPAGLAERHMGEPIPHIARHILGLTEEDADILFESSDCWPTRYTQDDGFGDRTVGIEDAICRLRDLAQGWHELARDEYGNQLD